MFSSHLSSSSSFDSLLILISLYALIDLDHLGSPLRMVVKDQFRNYCSAEGRTITPHVKMLSLFFPTSHCDLHFLKVIRTDGTVEELFLHGKIHLHIPQS